LIIQVFPYRICFALKNRPNYISYKLLVVIMTHKEAKRLPMHKVSRTHTRKPGDRMGANDCLSGGPQCSLPQATQTSATGHRKTYFSDWPQKNERQVVSWSPNTHTHKYGVIHQRRPTKKCLFRTPIPPSVFSNNVRLENTLSSCP